MKTGEKHLNMTYNISKFPFYFYKWSLNSEWVEMELEMPIGVYSSIRERW